MLSRFLHSDLSIDHDAIDDEARRTADATMARPGAAARTTWQTAYDAAHARYVDQAAGQRATELWHLEQDAEDARRAALPAIERRILALREAAHLAPMIDSTPAAIAAQEAAERELAAVMAEARV